MNDILNHLMAVQPVVIHPLLRMAQNSTSNNYYSSFRDTQNPKNSLLNENFPPDFLSGVNLDTS